MLPPGKVSLSLLTFLACFVIGVIGVSARHVES